jgi:hypothetical protein
VGGEEGRGGRSDRKGEFTVCFCTKFALLFEERFMKIVLYFLARLA